MKMAKKGPGMATLIFTGVMVCVLLLRPGSSGKTGECTFTSAVGRRFPLTMTIVMSHCLLGLSAGGREAQRDAIFREIIAKLTTELSRKPQRAPPAAEADSPVHPWVRNIMGSLQTFGLLPSKSLPSLSKPVDRHRLSGFLYNISVYLQEMGAELEEAPSEPQETQLWEKLLHFILQSEGLNQWSGRLPPRPSVKVQDLFLTLRGSPHWDWFLGLLQAVISLSERQPHRAILTYLSEHWRTVSAVLEVALQALISGTYGQASAGLQGFICALKGNGDCAFSVSWLQPLLSFLETQNWKPVVSLHPAAEGPEHSRSSSLLRHLKPFSLPPDAAKQERSSGNGSRQAPSAPEEDSDLMQSFLLQALFRSGGGERSSSAAAQRNLALVQSLDELRKGLLHRLGSSVYDNLRKKASQVTMVLLDDVSSLVEEPQPSSPGRCSLGE